MTVSIEELRRGVAGDGFCFVPGAELRPLLGALPDWARFAASWHGMPLDTHLPDGHRYRRRRYATLSARAGATDFAVEPHQPHYQAREYNRLVGGVERWFEPMPAEVLGGATLRQVVGFCLSLFGPLAPGDDWHVECHQFRIEARPDAAGLPTPEGVHRDGVDYVLVMLVARENIESGTTTVHDVHGRLLGSFTLTEAGDAALIDDTRAMHGVTPVLPLDPGRAACRDVLVVTFRRKIRSPGPGGAS